MQSQSRGNLAKLTLFIVWLLIALGFILAAGRGETWQRTVKSVSQSINKMVHCRKPTKLKKTVLD